MRIYCPHCNVKGSADDSYLGRKVRCPKCQETFLVERELSLDHVELETAPATAVDSVAGEEADKAILESPEVLEEQNYLEVAEESGQDEAEQAPPGSEEQVDPLLEETAALTEDADEQTIMPVGTESELEPGEDATMVRQPEEDAGVDEPPPLAVGEPVIATSVIENEPYGVSKEQCWQCGKVAAAGEPFIARDGRLYCPDCLPEESKEQTQYEEGTAATADERVADEAEDTEMPSDYLHFTVREALQEAWEKTTGSKGTIWAGTAIMYLVVLIVVAGGAVLFPGRGTEDQSIGSLLGTGLFQAVTDVVSMLFTAGLVFMGVRRAADQPIHWKMIFRGFQLAGKIIVATILQSALVLIGFLLLVLPGIYLMVGYAMTIPLIVDREMSPWQAMETSRKTVHKIWWKMAFLFLVMGLIFILSMIPLGLGLIWTWPMFILLAGVVYRYLFGSEKFAD
jgi:hypothetical protein